MTYAQIVNQIRRRSPMDVDTLLETCKFPLRYLGEGGYRKAYEIIGTGYVVKVPLDEYDSGHYHGRVEYATWRKVRRSNSKLAPLRKYMPSVMYFNRRNGCIVMPLYAHAVDRKYEKEMDRVAQMVFALTGNGDHDVDSYKWDNWGVDQNGQLIMIDLGCMETYD